jgi:hypothetical protein
MSVSGIAKTTGLPANESSLQALTRNWLAPDEAATVNGTLGLSAVDDSGRVAGS